MGNQDITEVDRLSDLPNDTILEIFSFLTTEDIISTSVLSKRWKGLWKEMRSLKFDSKLHGDKFSDNVISALMSYQHSTINSLTIRVKDKCNPIDPAIWVAIAFAKNVSKLVLRLDNIPNGIIFPEGTFGHRNTTKVLKIMGRMYFNLPLSNVTLHHLKELHLYHVKFKNTNSVIHLLKGCSVLEVLVMVIHINSGLLNTIINVPSLLKLTLVVQNCGVENFLIQTPCLEYMHIKKFEGVGSFLMEAAPKLTEARICRHNGDMLENILDSIPSAEHLTISAPMTVNSVIPKLFIYLYYMPRSTYFLTHAPLLRKKQPKGKTFHGLKTLQIDTKEDEWCNLLTHMLAYSPNLECLKILGGWYRFWGKKWTCPQCVPSCLGSRLRTLEWKAYICDESDDKEVAVFILKHAYNLRNAIFTIHKPNNALLLERRNQMMNTLSNVVRASPSCNLVFEDNLDTKSNNRSEEDPDIFEFSG